MKKHNDQKLDEVLKDMVSSYKLKPKLHQTKIRQLWADLLGPSISKHTRHLSIRGKVLYITIDSAPLKQELHFGKEKICNLLNEELGEEYLKDVVIR